MPALTLLALLVTQAGAAPPPEVRTVYVSITGEDGSPILDLRPEEVALLENGVVRDLTRMERDERPLTAAILVDSSEPLQSDFRFHLVDATVSLVSRLPAGTRFAIWTTGDRPERLDDFSTDPEGVRPQLLRVMPRGGNRMIDAWVEVPKDLKAQEGARTVVIALSGTGIGFTNYDRTHAVALAAEHPVLYYSVLFDLDPSRSFQALGGGEVALIDYEYVASELARRTGGYYSRILTAMGLGREVQKLAADLRSLYRISYATLPEIQKRKIEIQVARPEVSVRIGVPEVEEP
jgi:VWFA-related protein